MPVAPVPGLRPTADRVRESLFNWLQPLVPGARCLDLFAGTGALGLEAASRGAAEVTLVEAGIAGLTDGGLLHSIDQTEVGSSPEVSGVWTVPSAWTMW